MTNNYTKSTALHDRALKTIPLGSQTFSKSFMQFSKGSAPLFLERGEGVYVWDVDGNRYIDYLLGLLPIVLGYGYPAVDEAIQRQLKRGISFSLSSELEIDLSEMLVELIPCAEMTRFGKNGSDVTSAAIRLARAYTGRDKIAICGYHGWHDWYIGTTARNLGVPEVVQSLSDTFIFNDIDSLKALLEKGKEDYAAIILEPCGAVEPEDGFLEAVRDLADRYGVVLIFDEIVTGFRVSLGGAQEYYGVIPDLACFGKAMGNGMPISAVLGKAEIMKYMESIFFSGTFAGETLSLAASIATLQTLKKEDGVTKIWHAGTMLIDRVRQLIKAQGCSDIFSVSDVAWMPKIKISSNAHFDPQTINALLRQELLAAGLLMGSGFNLCLMHDNDEVVEETIDAFSTALSNVKNFLNSSDPKSHLNGAPLQNVFQVRSA